MATKEQHLRLKTKDELVAIARDLQIENLDMKKRLRDIKQLSQ